MNHIEIPIWNKCNNQCLMCTNTESMRKADVFNYDSVINYLEREIQKNKIKNLQTIGLTGGEPTICPDFFRIMNYLEQRFPKANIRILTNGRMLAYDNFRKKCLTFRNIDFIIPLHGYDTKTHDRITQVPGSFLQTVEGVKRLLEEKKTGQKIEIRIIATRLNLKIIPKIIELIKGRFLAIDRLVLIFLEFEGQAELNKDKVGISYRQIQPTLWQIKKYFKLFQDFRLYHFPLCILEPDFWPYCWRTLPEEEITYPPECKKCQLKKYCLGIHKSYLNYVKKPEVRPWKNLKGIEIKETESFYRPIGSLKIDKILADYKFRSNLTDFLMNQKTEPAKYFFSSLFFRLSGLRQFNAKEIKLWWREAAEEIKRNKRPSFLNFYLHIPFCQSRCSYCMYPSVVPRDKKLINDYLKRVFQEMFYYKDVFSGIDFTNLYIGGGSPNILDEKNLTKLLTNLFNNFSFSKSGQRNFECNPHDITQRKLDILKKAGFNRISFWAQSLDSKVLKHANRDYQTFKSIKKAIFNAKLLGFKVNVDLMIGLYGEDPSSVIESFRKIIMLKPTSISFYPLKPPNRYLEKYFGNDEMAFYSQLKRKIEQVIEPIKKIAIKFNYTYPETIHLTEGYCGDFYQKEEGENREYYDTHCPYSTFGIGSFSVSNIVGIGRYENILSPQDKFTPSVPFYLGAPSQLKDDMRDYILWHFAKGWPVSQKEFKKNFGQDLMNSFKYSFSALKKLKKVKIKEDLIYFLPRNFKEMFNYGLFFWRKEKLVKLLEKY